MKNKTKFRKKKKKERKISEPIYQQCRILKLGILEAMLILSLLFFIILTAEVKEFCFFYDIYLVNFCHYEPSL